MTIIKKIIIRIAILVLNLLYLPLKLFKTKNKITYISREQNTPSLDFILLEKQMKKDVEGIKQVMLTKKIGKGILEKLSYAFHIFIQMYHIATSKVVLVDTYIITVSVLKHKKSLKVIQIWHALGAVKKFGYQILGKTEGSSEMLANCMKMHKNYDYITCASTATAKFFSEAFNTSIEKIKIIGMPRVDYILNTNKNQKILKENPNYAEKKTILYIPTFRKNKQVYLDEIINSVDLEKYNLIIKIHPLDNTTVDEKYLIKGSFSTYDVMKFADYIISDYSATVIEASILHKPLFLYVYDIDEYKDTRGLNVNITEELKEYTSKDFKKIMNIIENDIYDFGALEKFRNKYVETYNENNTENVCKLIEENLKDLPPN